MKLDRNLAHHTPNSGRKVPIPTRPKIISPLLQGFVWGGTFTLTAIISGFLGMVVAVKTPLPVNVSPIIEKVQGFQQFGFRSLFLPPLQAPLNILVMGIDRVPDTATEPTDIFAGRSDTMLLIRVQPEDRSVRLMSIPRDTLVAMPGGGYDKINSLNALGGVDFTKQVLQQNFNDVPIHHHLRITTDAFQDLIDVLGGVEVYVPYDMQYTDATQNLQIDLKEGRQVLNGKQAEQFVRFRNDTLGDIGRVQRQQIVLKALREKMQNPLMIPRMLQAIALLQEKVDTDLSQKEILSLAGFARDLARENIKMVMLPGRFSQPHQYPLSYWLVSEEKTQKIMAEYFELPPTDNDSAADNRRSPKGIRIAIQNGTPNPELAIAVAKYLEKQRFRHVYLSRNPCIPLAKTQIIAQQGDYDSAQRLQQILQFGEADASSTGDLDSDITVKVGADAQQLLADETFAR